jgi:hypothetical protein
VANIGYLHLTDAGGTRDGGASTCRAGWSRQPTQSLRLLREGGSVAESWWTAGDPDPYDAVKAKRMLDAAARENQGALDRKETGLNAGTTDRG